MPYDSTSQTGRPSKKRRLNGKRVAISTYLEPADYDLLAEAASKNERTMAAELRAAVRKHLAREAGVA